MQGKEKQNAEAWGAIAWGIPKIPACSAPRGEGGGQVTVPKAWGQLGWCSYSTLLLEPWTQCHKMHCTFQTATCQAQPWFQGWTVTINKYSTKTLDFYFVPISECLRSLTRSFPDNSPGFLRTLDWPAHLARPVNQISHHTNRPKGLLSCPRQEPFPGILKAGGGGEESLNDPREPLLKVWDWKKAFPTPTLQVFLV